MNLHAGQVWLQLCSVSEPVLLQNKTMTKVSVI